MLAAASRTESGDGDPVEIAGDLIEVLGWRMSGAGALANRPHTVFPRQRRNNLRVPCWLYPGGLHASPGRRVVVRTSPTSRDDSRNVECRYPPMDADVPRVNR